jgi:hypothetical protein
VNLRIDPYDTGGHHGDEQHLYDIAADAARVLATALPGTVLHLRPMRDRAGRLTPCVHWQDGPSPSAAVTAWKQAPGHWALPWHPRQHQPGRWRLERDGKLVAHLIRTARPDTWSRFAAHLIGHGVAVTDLAGLLSTLTIPDRLDADDDTTRRILDHVAAGTHPGPDDIGAAAVRALLPAGPAGIRPATAAPNLNVAPFEGQWTDDDGTKRAHYDTATRLARRIAAAAPHVRFNLLPSCYEDEEVHIPFTTHLQWDEGPTQATVADTWARLPAGITSEWELRHTTGGWAFHHEGRKITVLHRYLRPETWAAQAVRLLHAGATVDDLPDALALATIPETGPDVGVAGRMLLDQYPPGHRPGPRDVTAAVRDIGAAALLDVDTLITRPATGEPGRTGVVPG